MIKFFTTFFAIIVFLSCSTNSKKIETDNTLTDKDSAIVDVIQDNDVQTEQDSIFNDNNDIDTIQTENDSQQEDDVQVEKDVQTEQDSQIKDEDIVQTEEDVQSEQDLIPNDSDMDENPSTINTIEKIQKGEIAEDSVVKTKAVVVAIDYLRDKTTHEPTGIKGLYVSEVIAQAKPYSGIFVHFKTAEPVDAYKRGDYLYISGTYKEYYNDSQIDATNVSKLGTKPIPTPAIISDTTKIASASVKDSLAEQYESVFIKISNISITKSDLGHGMFEVTGSLPIDKELHYYEGDRSVGVKFKSIRGILIYSFEAFKLAPREETDLILEDISSPDEDTIVDQDADSTNPQDIDNEIPDQDISGNFHLKIMAANITSGSAQAYQGPGIRIFQAIKPDVALVQEFNYKDGTIRELIDTAFGKNYNYCRGVGQIPNGIVTKFPILKCSKLDDPNIGNRDLDYAIIDLPGNKDLVAFSVHLHTKPSSDQVTAGKIIADKVYEMKQANPGKYYYVVGGDFNGTSSVSSSSFGAHSSFSINDDYPLTEDGYDGTNYNEGKHYDWVLVSSDLSSFQVSTNYGIFKYPHGLVFDSRKYSQSDLDTYFSPVLHNDSGASNMQHMSVTKDFVVSY